MTNFTTKTAAKDAGVATTLVKWTYDGNGDAVAGDTLTLTDGDFSRTYNIWGYDVARDALELRESVDNTSSIDAAITASTDQVYDGTSALPQSGVAVAEGIAKVRTKSIDSLKLLPISSTYLGVDVSVTEYHAGTGYGGGIWRVSTGLTANDIDIVQSTTDVSIQYNLLFEDGDDISKAGAKSNDATKDIGLIINTMVGKGYALNIVNRLDGSYNLATAINMVTGLRITGTANPSLVYTGAVTGFDLLEMSIAASNIEIEGFTLDASVNYPVGDVYHGDIAVLNRGAYLDKLYDNITFKNMTFIGFSHSSIHARGRNAKNLTITHCKFINGGYLGKVIDARSENDAVEAEYVDGVRIEYCEFYENGPQNHVDASKYDYVAGRDCIHCDKVKNLSVKDNKIRDVAGIGIRIEECIGGVVSGNDIEGTGQEGITIYYNTRNIRVVENTVANYGRTFDSFALRKYLGNYYIPREFPHITLAVLPADPSASSWFELNPYDITNVDELTIQDYDDTDYTRYAYRGTAGISYTSTTTRNVIANNVISGKVSTVNGLREYACDFGLTPVHTVNGPSTMADKTIIEGNIVENTWVADIYHPQYMDPINRQIALPKLYYGINHVSTINLFANKGNMPITGTFVVTLRPTNGTVTLNGAYDKLAYTRIGDVVHVIGQIRVSALGSPTGELFLEPLPFPKTAGPERSEETVGIFKGDNFTTKMGSDLIGFVGGAGTSITLLDDTVDPSVPATPKLTATSIITINLTYMTGDMNLT